MCVECVCIERKRERDGGREGGRKGEREKRKGEGRRERGVRGVYICVYVWGREGGSEGERGVTGVCIICVYMCPCTRVHVCAV